MIVKEQIIDIIAPHLTGDKFLIDVVVNPGNKIIVAIDNIKGLSIDTCAEIHRLIEASLDREIEDFELEVTSPGLTAPLKVPQQYLKNIGREVDILLKNGEKLKGKLLKVTEINITIEFEEVKKAEGLKKKIKVNIDVNFSDIKSTKLILTF